MPGAEPWPPWEERCAVPVAGASPEARYPQVSPQLLARIRQLWSARALDLDQVWRATIGELPGFRAIEPNGLLGDSRPVDLVLLFDQGASWLQCLLAATGRALREARGGQRTELSLEQLRALVAILSRLREEIAAVRAPALAGLATQIVRSISEDVDLALVMLLRPKLARRFVACRSPQEAGDFWRRHVAGGRAFRTVAEQLYRVGLDYSDDSSYARWRKEVQALLGAAVHTSFIGSSSGDPTAGPSSGARAVLTPAAQECVHFATLRLQEMCAYARMLGRALR
jgi:hypothetical protein